MKSRILTLAAIIALSFAANAHIVVMGGAVSVTQKPNGTTKIKCGNNPQQVCAIVGTDSQSRVVVEVGDDKIYGSSYEILGDEIIVYP